MRRYGPCLLLVLVGAAVLRISLFSELYLRYVQEGLRPYLVVSGGVLVLLGAAMAVAGRGGREAVETVEGRGEGEDNEAGAYGHGLGHDHGAAGPRIAWLLTLPALALLLFPPPALGSYSAEREAAQRAAQGVGAFPALPAGDPVELTLGAFGSRAIYDSGHSLKGRTVRMTGFVTHGDDGTWYLTRLSVTCCAADATTSKVEVRGATDGAPPVDTWVTVTGTWHPEGELGTDSAWPPVVDASAVRLVRQPADPYEKR
ncbi:TIGR03943 family protein [Streptomyces sp. NPDC006335]|uniref:TIGR03943 family putative permease subunit n=1 Tax=Streptomyces sp. NPDC006335 TaxID=3156895 RepID=UPI0033A27C18